MLRDNKYFNPESAEVQQFIRLLTECAAVVTFILVCQSVYTFFSALKRWSPSKRQRFLSLSTVIGLASLLLLLAQSTAEDWVSQLFAFGLTLYLVSCLAIFMSRELDAQPKPRWTDRVIVLLISQAFFAMALLLKMAAARARVEIEIDFAIFVPLGFGFLGGIGLSYARPTQWASTALSTQGYWWFAYLLLLAVFAKVGGFWFIPYMAIMIVFFPGIMMLVLLGTWLGYRCSEILHLPKTQRKWVYRLLNPKALQSASA